jgi:hypothetical protein
MRPRTLLLFALAALVGAAVAVLPALAASTPEAKLEVNENCVEADWPCWATPGSESPASTVTIAAGGEVMFTDNTRTAANIAWTGTAPTCSSGVPVSPTSPKTDWEGKCKFEQPGTYRFESSTLFKDAYENYTKYEIVVEGASTGTTSTTTTTSTTPTTTTPTTPTTTTPTTTTPTATLAAAPSEVKLEVNENCVESDWPCWAVPGSGANPAPASKVTIATGGEVKFADDATAAAVVWMGSAPACSGVPTSAMTKWEGVCKFEQPGTYKFESSTLFNEGGSLDYTKYEVVVEGAATGTTPTTTSTTTAPTTTTTTAPTTPSEPSFGSPLAGGPRALELAGSQHGSTVHGSIKVSQAGSGGRLEVGLLAAGASLAKAGHPAQVRVGRLVRSSLKVGNVSFSVPLNAKGKAALRRHRRLALTVKITLTPLHGAAVTVTRLVVVHA